MTKLASPTNRSPQAGFTLIELLMAMAVFSFMLLIVTAGFLQVIRIQQSGVASRATQQNARLVLDDIMKETRQASAATSDNTTTARTLCATASSCQTLCLSAGGSTQQYYVDNGDLKLGSIPDPGGSCPEPASTAGWSTINDASVQVTQFAVTTTPSVQPGLGTAMVTITLASKNNLNALDSTKTRCQPGSGSQFCAVTTLSSGASLRGGEGQ